MGAHGTWAHQVQGDFFSQSNHEAELEWEGELVEMTSEEKPLIRNSAILLNYDSVGKESLCQNGIHSQTSGTHHVIPVTLAVQEKLQGKLS